MDKVIRYPLYDVMRLGLALDVLFMHITKSPMLTPAVPAFVAISGFLIPPSLERSGSWREFFRRRALRLFPAFGVMLLLVIALFGVGDALKTAGHYASGGLWGQSKNNAVWSLAWEDLLYTSLVGLYALGVYRKPWMVWSLCGVAIAAMFAFVPQLEPGVQQWALTLPSAFLIGNLAYIYREKIPRFRYGGFALIPAALWLKANSYPLPVVTVVIALGLLLLGGGFTPKLPKMPDLSYSVYIYHMPLLLAIGHGWQFWIVLAATCTASWYLIEKPALSLKGQRRPAPASAIRGCNELAAPAASAVST